MSQEEFNNITAFKAWLVENGANVHPNVFFEPVASGFNAIANDDVPVDATIVSIPFSLAITPGVSKKALEDLFENFDEVDGWSERQLECTYMCMHSIVDPSISKGSLRHGQYLNTLPSAEKLRTPLHFSAEELNAFQGSNLYGATLDRRRDWEGEWQQCAAVVARMNTEWGKAFTLEKYLTASTYISSRAFPSTVLSSTPSLLTTPQSHPVLLPGIDALNHARGHPVSWVVSSPSSSSSGSSDTSPREPSISLVIRTPTPRGSELLNNYGPKPNSELILGYGFSLPSNPDDTIVLKIGGRSAAPPVNGSHSSPSNNGRFEVGRDARGAEAVWEAVIGAIRAQVEGVEESSQDDDGDDEPTSIEDELCAADMLAEMAQQLHDRLPPFPPANTQNIRPEVLQMLEHYLEGQRDILQALVAFARRKEECALEMAREQGLDMVDEEDEEDEEDA